MERELEALERAALAQQSAPSWQALAAARERAGDLRGASRALERAFQLAPGDASVGRTRAAMLDLLALQAHGLQYRFVPGGPFRMGSERGDPDERPEHVVWVGDFWIMEAPVSWEDYCRLMDWRPPPEGCPRPEDIEEGGDRMRFFYLREANKVRLQYCEDATSRAVDWHAHAGGDAALGSPPREPETPPLAYPAKPMVAIGWQDAEVLAARLGDPEYAVRLPTEAEWEKAARGGLVGAPYPHGDAPATPDRVDCDRFGDFRLLPSRQLPPNGYGLHAMSGGVWEWTATAYDALAYRTGAAAAAPPPEAERVVRGGSWADSAEACTVSFRSSLASRSWTREGWGPHINPTVGFRLVRVPRGYRGPTAPGGCR